MAANDGILIITVNSLELRGTHGRGIQLEDSPVPLFITNDRALIKDLCSPRFVEAFGEFYLNDILSKGCALYSRFNHKVESREDLLYRCLGFSKGFFDALWFIKDNSVHPGQGFLECHRPNGEVQYDRNYLVNSRAFNSQGHDETCHFSVEELKRARQLYKSHMRVNIQELGSDYRQMIAETGTFAVKGSGRVSRATYFLTAARQEIDLGVKLSLYMSCLESLLTTDAGEVTHKLGERAAFFIGDNAVDRERVFSNLKRAYKVRSKVLHGDVLTTSDQQALRTVSEAVDKIVRDVLSKLINEDELRTLFEEGKSDSIESYFSALVFGAR